MNAAATWQLYDGSAETYERYRPTYPAATLHTLKQRLGALERGGKALDAGAGTGLFSRQLLSALPGLEEITCVEPNQDMIRVGQHACVVFPRIRYQRGFAEVLPVPDHRFALVTASAAANWFDRPKFLREALRVLVPGGVLALLQNKPRYWDCALVSALSDFLDVAIPGYRRGTYSDFNSGYGPADFVAELRETGLFRNVTKHSADWEQRMTPEEFRGFCYSMGHMKKAQATLGAAKVAADIDDLIDRHVDREDRLIFAWSAELTLANAPEPT